MFISNAFAAGTPAAGPDLMGFLPLVVIFILFYFMLIRPQMKRAKEQKNMMDALQKGDEVVTTGGILGKVVKVSDGHVGLEIGENMIVTVQKPAIATLLPKGTIKSI